MGYFKYCGESGLLVLKNLQIKVTPPNEFNDPFEFSPVVRNPNPKAYAQKTVKEILRNPQFFEESRLQFPNIKNFAEFQAFVRANLTKVTEMLAADTPRLDESLNVLNTISEIHGLICFSADPVQLLMWSDYGAAHKGIVLEFDESSSFFNPNSFLKVEYDITRVQYNPDGEDQKNVVELFVKRKSPDWQYEQEYRLIIDLAVTHRQVVQGNVMHLLDIKPELLKSVTLGLRATDITRGEVLSLVSKSPLNHLHIFQIQADKTEFKLHRIRIK